MPAVLTPARPRNDSTRREFVAGGFTLGALWLAGCGEPDGDTAASNDAGFPVTLEHRYGTTRIEARPKRVVTLGASDHDPVLAVGVTPVMVAKTVSPETFHAWNADKVGSPRPAEHPPIASGDINFELVASQRPDLILSLQADLAKRDYERLSQLAPTIAPDGRYEPFATPWPSMTRVVGRALGRVREAEQAIADAQERIARTRSAHPTLEDATVLIATVSQGTVGLNAPGITRYSAFEALGMVPEVPGLDRNAQEGTFLSLEELDRLNGTDVIVWIGPTSQKVILNQPTYVRQAVHQEGRELFPAEKISPALAFPSVLGTPYAAERFAPDLAAAADRDPGTRLPGSA